MYLFSVIYSCLFILLLLLLCTIYLIYLEFILIIAHIALTVVSLGWEGKWDCFVVCSVTYTKYVLKKKITAVMWTGLYYINEKINHSKCFLTE